MVKKAKKHQKHKGIGLIIGGIPILLIGLICIDIYIENFSRTEIAKLQAEIIDYPQFTDEILFEITQITIIGMIFLVIGIILTITAISFLTFGIMRKIE